MRTLLLSSFKWNGVVGKLLQSPPVRGMSSSSTKFWLLSYDYNPENILERRAPLRPSHLALVKEYADEGKLLAGGAFADPIDGAAILFKGTKEEVEGFIRKDPYVLKGIVTKHWIREWTLVAGAWLQN